MKKPPFYLPQFTQLSKKNKSLGKYPIYLQIFKTPTVSDTICSASIYSLKSIIKIKEQLYKSDRERERKREQESTLAKRMTLRIEK